MRRWKKLNQVQERKKKFLIFVLCLIPTVSFAQLVDIKFKYLNWQVGQWVKYQVESGGENMEIKYSIVGEEKIGNEVYYWFETKNSTKEGNVIMKMLMSTKSKTGPKRLIIKHGSEPAIEMDMQFAKSMTQPHTKPTIVEENAIIAGAIGYEIIKVPAGEFDCLHSRVVIKSKENASEKIDYWVSDKVPILGAVKSVAKDMKMTLLDYGLSGAETEIKETPQKMQIPFYLYQSP